MRILFAIEHTYLPQRTGGAEVSTHALCRVLSARGHQVAVLAHLMPEGLLGAWNRLRRWAGIAAPSDHVMGYQVYREWDPILSLDAVLEAFRPEVAVIKSEPDVTLLQFLLNRGIPSVLYLHDLAFDNESFRPPAGDRLLVVANATYTAERYRDRFGVRPVVIPLLIDPDEYRVETRRKVVTFINPVESKGLEIAFALANSRPDIPFEFVESWPMDESAFSAICRRAKALGNVQVRRWVREMRRIYERSRLLIVPSQAVEAFGRVVAEAQVSGIPVIASKIGGLPESVGRGGILVDPFDMRAWERALGRLWDNRAEYDRLVKAALLHAQRREIQPDYVVSKFLAVIEEHIRRMS